MTVDAATRTVDGLRQFAISLALPKMTGLAKAVGKLGFVQADPIRAPARAQDLILRHRVTDYRAGDLERDYSKLRIEEDYLYAYGFMPKSTWMLLHPRKAHELTSNETDILHFVQSRKQVHPRDLEGKFGKSKEMNAWGGMSKATTRSLEKLHYLGLLRVVGRTTGIRTYQTIAAPQVELEPEERLRRLVLLIARNLAPISVSALRSVLQHLRHAAPGLPGRLHAVQRLLGSGLLAESQVDGVRYVWPADCRPTPQAIDVVRFLAPFDPLVWDRRRFEHLWGWPYRFEAYTPPSKRKLGYYALPLLWQSAVIGWVNITKDSGGRLHFKPGFVAKSAPSGTAFRSAFEEEVENMIAFLQPRQSS